MIWFVWMTISFWINVISSTTDIQSVRLLYLTESSWKNTKGSDFIWKFLNNLLCDIVYAAQPKPYTVHITQQLHKLGPSVAVRNNDSFIGLNFFMIELSWKNIRLVGGPQGDDLPSAMNQHYASIFQFLWLNLREFLEISSKIMVNSWASDNIFGRLTVQAVL